MEPITTAGNTFATLSDDELVERVKDLAASPDNIQLRCRAHNQYEARLFFGDALVRERPEMWSACSRHT